VVVVVMMMEFGRVIVRWKERVGRRWVGRGTCVEWYIVC
jgi:hypothetical protein